MNIQIIRTPTFQRPSGYLYLNSTQSNIADATPVKVNLDAIQGGFNDGIEDISGYKITPGKAGLYLVHGQANFSQIDADKQYHVKIYINGAEELYNYVQGSYTAAIHAAATGLFWLAATDYIELYVLSMATSGAVDINSGYRATYLFVQRVR